jgi:Ran GTPase-activating protein (RanGAP) involved in mRNA processing and transport
MSELTKALASPRKFITSTLSKTNTSRKPQRVDALRQQPLPPLKKFDASSLPQGCVKAFFFDGEVPTKTDAQADIARFCLKNEQSQAMAWLFLKLEDVAPGKQQALALAHTDQVSPKQRLNSDDAKFLARWLAKWLGSLPLLTSVDLNNNFIGDKGVEAFAKLLSQNPPLQHLNIGSCSAGRSITKMAEALLQNTTLLSIDLSFNAGDEESASAFREMLTLNTTLQSLDISNLHTLMNRADLMRTVANGLADNGTLLHFGAAYLPMTEKMIDAIQSNTALTSINLNATSTITPTELLTALSNHPLLKRIQLYRCVLQEAGVEALLALIKKPGLEAIDVSYCNLSRDTVKTILEVVSDSQSMQYVDLSGNSLKGQGAGIAAILTRNEKLKSFLLADTHLSSRDLVAIVLAVDGNHGLLELDLSGNRFFTEEQASGLQQRLLLNVRPTDAQRINAANALHMLVTRKHDHKIPPELTTVITGFMALMGSDGVDSLDNLTATAGRLPSVHPSD